MRARRWLQVPHEYRRDPENGYDCFRCGDVRQNPVHSTIAITYAKWLRELQRAHAPAIRALMAVKLRIHFIGMPQEDRQWECTNCGHEHLHKDHCGFHSCGCTCKKVRGRPKWKDEIAFIEKALLAEFKRTGAIPKKKRATK